MSKDADYYSAEVAYNVGSGFAVDEAGINKQALEEAEEELARLLRWQEELRACGKPDKAAELDYQIGQLEEDINELSVDLGV